MRNFNIVFDIIKNFIEIRYKMSGEENCNSGSVLSDIFNIMYDCKQLIEDELDDILDKEERKL